MPPAIWQLLWLYLAFAVGMSGTALAAISVSRAFSQQGSALQAGAAAGVSFVMCSGTLVYWVFYGPSLAVWLVFPVLGTVAALVACVAVVRKRKAVRAK